MLLGKQGTVFTRFALHPRWALLKTSLLADAVSHYMNYEL